MLSDSQRKAGREGAEREAALSVTCLGQQAGRGNVYVLPLIGIGKFQFKSK